ncbi:helix-turn-helix domain-containing protein [Streptomyces shenzhenensis]|uniref:helix-turn-helix domain-containing protein n=1 Tax=Streptomyces shenzhenensis TaxID=943815 RepID=UPI003D89BF17
MTEPLPPVVLTRISRAGMVLPPTPGPAQSWQPRTAAERHLQGEVFRLDRVRRVLLGEVDRLRRASPGGVAQPAPVRCPLTPKQLDILAGAAAGETSEDTSRRLLMPFNTVKTHRQRAVRKLGARGITHAVAIVVAAGWIPRERVTGDDAS